MIDQAIIAACGVATVFLSQDSRAHYRRWACIAGCISQPAWFYATWQAQQWGMFALSIVFTFGWLRGVWYFWIRGRAS